MNATSKTFSEFFAGIGLVHLGLQSSGWQCVYANDIEPKKHAMYEGQFGPAPYYHVGDIWQTDAVLERISSSFLATASFPCVDLSLAGHWKGFSGERSSTYFGFLEVIRRLENQRPAVVMLENVYGFLTARGGEDFRRALTELAELGYWIDAMVLDARWFVPQSRPRLFVFGFHESLDTPRLIRRNPRWSLSDPWQLALNESSSLRPPALQAAMEDLELPTGWATQPLKPPRQSDYSLNDALDLDDEQSWWSEESTLRHYNSMEPPSRKRVDDLIQQGTTAAGAAFRRTRRGATRCEVRFDVAGCLRTPKGGSAKQIVVAISGGNLRMRWMSSREYARLQGAGDFRIAVPEIQAMYGFGDAVCVPAIEWIDQHVLTPIFQASLVTADHRPARSA